MLGGSAVSRSMALEGSQGPGADPQQMLAVGPGGGVLQVSCGRSPDLHHCGALSIATATSPVKAVNCA